MHFFQDKKSMIKESLIGIIILTAGFFLIFSTLEMFKGKAEAKTAESICRGSVALREKSYTEIKDPVTGELKLGGVATPLLCKTLDKYIPEDKDATKEQVQKEFANLMASCWNQFGEGLIKDPFKQGDGLTNNCFICYEVNLRETSKFKDGIKSTEFVKYLFEIPYKVSPETDNCKVNGGFCINSENECGAKIKADSVYLLTDKKSSVCQKKGKNTCCYTDYECWNKGGVCSGTNPDTNNYRKYDKWDCPSKMSCFVKNENFYSYGEYVQRYGGNGVINLLTDIKPGETYAISYGSPNTDSCNWCTTIGLSAGAGGATAALLAFSGPAGWTIAAAGATGAIIYTLVKGTSEMGVEVYREYIQQRKYPTIYLTTLNQMLKGNLCTLVENTSN